MEDADCLQNQGNSKPFGKAVVDEDPDGDGMPVENNLMFPGQYYDAETGLHYNYHRDYDPGTGRYLEADPLGIDQGRNHLYVYAAGNPLLFYDSNGWLPKKRFCNPCDPSERSALQMRYGLVCGRLDASNFSGGEDLGFTTCAPFYQGFVVKQYIKSNCVYNCVWEHEFKHYQDCLKLGKEEHPWRRQWWWNVDERPGWEAERGCLAGYLSQSVP